MDLSESLVQGWRAFHFMRPAWLLALPLLWAAVAWLARRRARDGDWSALIDADLLPALRLSPSGKGEDGAASADGAPTPGRRATGATGTTWATPWRWLLLAWTLATLALAGPSWQRDATPAFRAPAAWVLVLDLSPSMAAADLAPNRATRARYAIDDLLAAARDARVGLVVFGDEAYTVAPLTDDVDTVRALLPPLAPDILPAAGDQLAPALARAGQLLAGSGVRRGRVIVLTDGFGDPSAALQAAAALHASGASVDVVGIGTTAGAPVPNSDGGFLSDSAGKPQLARLAPELLQGLAAAGHGRYVDLAGLPTLTAALQAEPLPSPSGSDGGTGNGIGTQATSAGIEVAHWRDAGAWLLPGLLLVVAALARRGWL
jgi:Ca-activated chloride channel family protein